MQIFYFKNFTCATKQGLVGASIGITASDNELALRPHEFQKMTLWGQVINRWKQSSSGQKGHCPDGCCMLQWCNLEFVLSLSPCKSQRKKLTLLRSEAAPYGLSEWILGTVFEGDEVVIFRCGNFPLLGEPVCS